MRALTLFAILIALAIVTWQQLGNLKRTVDTEGGAVPVTALPDKVRTDVNAATERYSEKLREAAGSE